MNRYKLHIPRTSISWTDVKPGQIWGLKKDPDNTKHFIKIDRITVTGNKWNLTSNRDIEDATLRINYVLVYNNEKARKNSQRRLGGKYE